MLLITTIFIGKRIVKRTNVIASACKRETKQTLRNFGFTGDDISDLLSGFPVETSNKTYTLKFGGVR